MPTKKWTRVQEAKLNAQAKYKKQESVCHLNDDDDGDSNEPMTMMMVSRITIRDYEREENT
jgi:hypothetical protein